MSELTRYRAFLILNGTRTALVGTTERKTKGALLKLIQANGKMLLDTLPAADLDTEWSFKAGVVTMGSAQFVLDFIPAHEVRRVA